MHSVAAFPKGYQEVFCALWWEANNYDPPVQIAAHTRETRHFLTHLRMEAALYLHRYLVRSRRSRSAIATVLPSIVAAHRELDDAFWLNHFSALKSNICVCMDFSTAEIFHTTHNVPYSLRPHARSAMRVCPRPEADVAGASESA